MNWLKRLLGKTTGTETRADVDTEALRAAFRARYDLFLSLLSSNNQALEIMAEMEKALKGERPFGMGFVRSRCTRAAASAYNMVRCLCELTPDRYDTLFSRFDAIKNELEPVLSTRLPSSGGPLTMPLSEARRDHADLAGSKMASLGELSAALDVDVPDGFIITSVAFQAFMEHGGLQDEINRRIQAASDSETPADLHRLSSELQEMVIAAEVPESVAQAIEDGFRHMQSSQDMGMGLRLALRSSAVGEDFAGVSFAGQYRTELNVGHSSLLTAYREVVASKYALTAMSYRLARGIRDEETPMCVGCMKMVDAACGGVLYTTDPLAPNSGELIVSAVFGLPKPVVDGSAPADQYALSKTDSIKLVRREIADKAIKYECLPGEGVCRQNADEHDRSEPVLDDDRARELAALGLRIENYFSQPMDVEWAYEKSGGLVLLQCRPLPMQAAPPATDAPSRDERFLLEGGVTASRGAAAGPVFKMRKEADMLSFPKGGVLVTAQSSPRMAPLLARAAAVVAEQGSVTGHLANVAREFGVPALLGLTGAMDALPDGTLVTVDADGRRVLDGKVHELLAERPEPRNLMEGSSVLEALRRASALVVPLKLLDPESTHFRASNCNTLHDITRFCHEKGVHEMFRFGKRQDLAQLSSKRLVSKAPMQWWVLNLDDGFTGEVPGNYVHLSTIASAPMLALWHGITAVTWEGPPAVDGKGFMAVLFQSTMNRSLDPAAPSQYASRNYFMISKNYCSLHSRFGYHFAQVESLVGERARENYASFRFQGGAADETRRAKRVDLVAELLEEYDFRVEIRDDCLTARLERMDRQRMEAGLRVLGYLLMHTRQLDMIMNNAHQVAVRKAKMRNDLAELATI